MTIVSRKVLVTGGAGFIGSAVVRRLLRLGAAVINVDKLTYAASLDGLAEAADHPRYVFEQQDICDRSAVANVFARHAPNSVIHLAAETHVDRSIDEPSSFVQANVVGTAVLLEATRAHFAGLPDADRKQFRFVHVSTDEVFGSLNETGAFSEESRYQPTSPYSASKAASDHFARAWHHTYGLPVVVTNCSNNYGPYQFPEKLIPLMIANALEDKPLPVYGTGQNVRDWLYVDDHANALIHVLQHGCPGQTYNIGGRAEMRNIDLVTSLCRLLDEISPSTGGPREGLIRFVADRPGHDKRYAMDAGKIERELGWRPAESFESGLRKTVHWYVAHRSWWQNIRARRYDGRRLGLPARVAAE